MFYGVPGGLSGAAWGTQDSNGVWSGWANPAPQQVAAYDPGAGAAFGGAADAYMGDPNAYAAQMPAPVAPAMAPQPAMGRPDMSAGGSMTFNGGHSCGWWHVASWWRIVRWRWCDLRRCCTCPDGWRHERGRIQLVQRRPGRHGRGCIRWRYSSRRPRDPAPTTLPFVPLRVWPTA